MKRIFFKVVVVLGMGGLALQQPLAALPVEIDLTPYATRNITANLVAEFPTGEVVPRLNTFGVPFRIPAEGKNFLVFEEVERPVVINVGAYGVKKVYTLIQAYGPRAGENALTVEFKGSAGADQNFTLIIGRDVRDFFESAYSREINNTTTRPAIDYIGQGGAYTDNTKTGPHGFYHFDEQEFVLDPSFANQKLATVSFTRHMAYGTPMILGLTAVTYAEPPFYQSTAFLFLVIVGVIFFGAIGVALWISRERTPGELHQDPILARPPGVS